MAVLLNSELMCQGHCLIHGGIVTKYGALDQGQQCSGRVWLVARRHQAITRANIDLLLEGNYFFYW